jgi:hypothetical protein
VSANAAGAGYLLKERVADVAEFAAAKILIEQASDLLMQARPMQERSWTRILEPSYLPHMRLRIATRLALADGPGVYDSIGDLAGAGLRVDGKKTGGELASIGLALVTIGDVHEGIQAG